MNSNKITARTFGILLLIAYLTYGIGFGIASSIINSPIGFSYIFENKKLVIFAGAILMAIFAMLNIIISALLLPILKKYNPAITYSYFGVAIASTIMLAVGAIFLLLLIPISDAAIKADTNSPILFETLKLVCVKGNFFSYQIGMAMWGIGGLMFCYLLYISKIVPRYLSIWGFGGYVIFISGAIFALFGYEIDVIMDIPGGLFEVYLCIRLIIKGFDKSEENNLIPNSMVTS